VIARGLKPASLGTVRLPAGAQCPSGVLAAREFQGQGSGGWWTSTSRVFSTRWTTTCLSPSVRREGDDGVIKLIRGYLNAGVMSGTGPVHRQGTPHKAAAVALLLSNILLDDLDKELEARGTLFAVTRTTATSTLPRSAAASG